jgi:P-type Cu+ transporter
MPILNASSSANFNRLLPTRNSTKRHGLITFQGEDKMEKLRTISANVTELLVDGMTCPDCARTVTDAIQGAGGVRSASVSLENMRATVRWNPESKKNVSAVVTAVKNAGYEAKELPAGAAGDSARKQGRWRASLWLGLAVTAALMIGEWGFGLMMAPWFQWLAFALASVVQFFCGAQFYRGAWRQLKVGSSNMDTLVALGSTTAFGYSTWALLSGAGGHVYFMEAAAIISFIGAGHWLEARVSNRASGALKSLLNLAPETARKISSPRPAERGEGQGEGPVNLKTLDFPKSEIEVEVPVSELIIGDFIALRPGDRVPVDGMVLEGESAVNEAMLTGEAVPADKKCGSELFAGTVNINGRLVMRVTATGEATALAHIIAAVQRAQTSRAGIQRLGDRISNVFVPVIIATALAAGIFWEIHSGAEKAFVIAAGILIVACPCAMGLATPAAIMAAANAAARRGILIRDGVALEKAGKITAVIFDKTGTLTMGKPEVTASWSSSFSLLGDTLKRDLQPNFALAAALARNSTHPISQAIAKLESEGGVPRCPDLNDWKEIRGCGVEAKLYNVFSLAPPKRGEGRGEGFVNSEPSTTSPQPSPPLIGERAQTVRLGSLRWLKESDVDLAAGEKFITEWSQQGVTIVGLAAENNLLGLFAVRDALKVNAKQVVTQLQQQGLEIYLVTGDYSPTAASIASQVGITPENVFAGVRPEQKAEFVRKLQAGSGTGILPVRSKNETHRQDACATIRVAFVGDGINDAPALTQADLGIAVSRASDVAREAADIILLKSEIEAVPEALGLARATLRTIKQNLFWAFFYNALGVPLAAMGFISPIFCAAAMGASDLIVIGNALRLLKWRK